MGDVKKEPFKKRLHPKPYEEKIQVSSLLK
jgi:hypothetical protein